MRKMSIQFNAEVFKGEIMSKNINEKTISAEKFIKYFRIHLDLIISVAIKEDKNCNIYKKLLLVALIDAIAKPIYPYCNNKNKFISFIKKFSDWTNIDRISLPHLVQLLDKCPSPDFSNLRNYAYSKYDEWLQGSVILIDKDLEFKEVKILWPKNKDQDKGHLLTLKGITIESLRHCELFYKYRNSLVHELTEPGISFQPTSCDEPNYGSYTENGQHHWNLRYPVNFFIRLVKTCLNNLEKYLIEERIDPMQFYKFGSYWLKEFNC